ncbi:hypothetical protein K9F17_21055, partial [Stenotrophomonas acidaminiphila]|nr:hypothetical protein [Stenotrophomonas acidaminiphila]
GSEYIEKEISSGTSGLVYALQLAGQFAAGVFVILAGVRLILGEIVPAFKGISDLLARRRADRLAPVLSVFEPADEAFLLKTRAWSLGSETDRD